MPTTLRSIACRLAIREAAMASRTVAPAGRRTLVASTRLGSASTTSTRMQLVGAAREGVHHRVGDVIEERAEQRAHRAAGEVVAQRELDLARRLAERLE